MKRKHVNYAAGLAICLTMTLAPMALYRTVRAGVEDLEEQVFTAETPAQYAEEFSGGQSGAELVTDELFIPDAQLEAFKQRGLTELSRLGLELPDSFEFLSYFNGSFFAPADDDGGLSLGLLWCNKSAAREYISIGFNDVDIDAGTGILYFIQANECYDISLLSGFIEVGKSQFIEKLSPIPENYETDAFIVWQYPNEDSHPETRVQITWKDPMESQIMTNLTIAEPISDLVNYSITFDKADINNHEGKIIAMLRNGVFVNQQDMFHPIEDFTEDEMEEMEKAARIFAEDKEIYAGGVLSARGQNFGAGASGVRLEFESEGRNGYDHNVIITVTRTGTVVGYAISL